MIGVMLSLGITLTHRHTARLVIDAGGGLIYLLGLLQDRTGLLCLNSKIVDSDGEVDGEQLT